MRATSYRASIAGQHQVPSIPTLQEGDTLEEDLKMDTYEIPDEPDVPLDVVVEATYNQPPSAGTRAQAHARESAGIKNAFHVLGQTPASNSQERPAEGPVDDGGNIIISRGYSLRARAREAVSYRE